MGGYINFDYLRTLYYQVIAPDCGASLRSAASPAVLGGLRLLKHQLHWPLLFAQGNG